MNIYQEVKEIAELSAKIKYLSDSLYEKVDCYGIDWRTARFVSLSREDIEKFNRTNSVTEDYFVDQRSDYCEDCFYGWLYFKTDTSSQYVKVYFEL